MTIDYTVTLGALLQLTATIAGFFGFLATMMVLYTRVVRWFARLESALIELRDRVVPEHTARLDRLEHVIGTLTERITREESR